MATVAALPNTVHFWYGIVYGTPGSPTGHPAHCSRHPFRNIFWAAQRVSGWPTQLFLGQRVFAFSPVRSWETSLPPLLPPASSLGAEKSSRPH